MGFRKLYYYVGSPDNSDNIHLTMLSTLARNLMDDDFRSGLLEATSVEDIKKSITKGGLALCILYVLQLAQ